MDLRSHSPYPLLRHGILNTYPSLSKNIKTDVAIIGAGISGALAAWYLHYAGFKVTVLDRRHVAMGSTSASTSLLQYEIDTPLRELMYKVGTENAIKSYQLCRDAIYKIQAICQKLNEPDLFQKKSSLQYASFKKDKKSLYSEYLQRAEAGIKVHWLESEDLREKYNIVKPGAILSSDGGELDVYKMTHAMLKRCVKGGMELFDHTEVTDIKHLQKGVELTTGAGNIIKARWLIIACGYESQQYISKKIQYLHSTYSIASEPYAQKDFWYQNSLIWETATPYLYLRTTNDKRIIIGGKDTDFYNPKKRDELIPVKTKALEKEFKKLFPDIPFKTDFSWAGTFASTKDGLPYIGSISERPNTFFALGFGGNGITFSVIAAEIIKRKLTNKENKYDNIFSFTR